MGRSDHKRQEYTEVGYDEIVDENDRSYLFEIDGRQIWISKSMIEDDGLDETTKTVSIEKWLAIKENLT